MQNFKEFFKQFNIVAVTGNAGAGKTTFSKKLSDTLPYSLDYRFIGNSEFRKKLLDQKSQSISAYIDACNQLNWWNWDLVEQDLKSYLFTGKITLDSFYDRDTGESGDNLIISGKPLIVEGAILGTEPIINLFDKIIFIYADPETRFERLYRKDLSRRNFQEIISRFLITEYSEHKYYTWLFKNFSNKILFLNQEGDIDAKIPDYLHGNRIYLPLKMG